NQTNSATASSPSDTSAGNNTASDTNAVTENVVLHVTKAFADNFVNAGDGSHTFTLDVSNSGLSDADNVSLTDTVDGRLIVDSINVGTSGFVCSDPDSNAQTITCSRAHLDPSDLTKTITVTYHVA